ncbi:hypothetical protein [Paenibacillus sp. P32E]|uniref:hypothetical protein n=1 Tax=Paenibacillus sp. P32E TaxID=1349434 RepID=UPI00093F18E9|nr:hypothetical protein [Paenibacillus sp. P32E]OKP91423.1 hypothetical protein A3848_09990 [Paenibacillus sp. P32E]
MSTKLEQIQSAAKAKSAAGQPIFNTPITNTPAAVQSVKAPASGVGIAAIQSPTVAAPAPINTAANPSKNASVIVPGQQAEIQRKASAGIALTNPTAATTAAYNAAKAPAIQAPVAAVKPTTAPAVQPNTNYVENGGQTLNDILYLKDNYRTDNKNYTAAQSNPLYSKLDQKTAAMVKGMSADQLRNYINGLGTQQTATTQNEGSVSAAPDYTALATAAYQQQLDQLLAGAQSQEKELNRRYDYANGVTQDNRQLETASFYRNNAPTAWDGSTGYQAAQTDRNRSIEDHYTQEGLTDATAAAYNTANAFRDNSANFISTKSNELQTQAQQLAMQEAGLTGTYKGNQTIQGAASAAQTAGQLISNQGQAISNQGQQIANQIAQINLDNYPSQVKLQLQQLQQQVNSGSISNATAQYQFKELTDPNSVTNKVSALDLQMKQIDASNYSATQKLQLEQLQKTVDQIGKAKPVSEYEQQMQYLDLQKAQLQIQQLQTETATKGKTAEDYATSYLDKSVQRDDEGSITNINDVKAQILQSGLPDSEIAKLYLRYGIPLPQGYSGN